MFTDTKTSILSLLLITASLLFIESADLSDLNITRGCFRCLCHVYTYCTISNECGEEYCGPFHISKSYWIEAGNITLEGDDPDRKNAWKDCANDYFCAQDIMKGYLQKFSKDCNSDGMINCYDILTINSNGGDCRPLNQSLSGRVWLKRYEECRVARILA
ncbi:lysozyme-like [Danaus plexippus]|uniref:lysozyme-like n=1 Tax=Danaus plexippus TaxID=13037 RepID=UPI002AAFDFE7|nr:lysozyme-like [Danaus plexippus]